MANRVLRTTCHTPTPGKKPTAIPTWKYDLVRNAILEVVPKKLPGYPCRDLPAAIQKLINPEKLEGLGSVGWHTTTVRLNMEVVGELQRIPKSKPLHVIRT